MASKMYSDGIDVIYHAAGLGGLGAIEVAKKWERDIILLS